MSTRNGPVTLDPALLKVIYKRGYCILVADYEDATLIFSHDMPALNIPDVDLLTYDLLKPIASLAILHPYGPKGEAFAEGIRLRLEDIVWQGTIKYCPLPEDCPTLTTLAERYRGEPHRFSGFLLDLFTQHEGQQMGAPKAEANTGEEWPEPLPLPEVLLTVEPFEPKLLPEAFRRWIEDIAERMQCPLDYPAVAAMIAEAAVVGRRVGIRPKRHDDWLVVANLWGGVIGPPGVLKTPAIQEALKPVYRMEFDAGRDYETELKQWQMDKRVLKEEETMVGSQIREALKEGNRDKADRLAAQLQEQLSAALPSRKRLIVNDSTVEKLGELLNQNPNGLLIFRDELTGFLRSMDREGHETDRAFYLEAWNGTGRFVCDRIGRGTIDIKAACVSILGSIQPGPLGHYLRAALDGGVGDDGLMQRFQLLIWPDVPRDWKNIDRWPETQAKRQAFEVFQRLNALTSAAADARCDEEEEGSIPYLQFDAAAQEMFDTWRAELELNLRKDDEHAALIAHLAKYRSLVPTLALLIHLADGGRTAVSLDAVERACGWADYLQSHARRVYGRGFSEDYVAAQALARKIQESEVPQAFSAREVYRHHWAHLATPEDVSRAVQVLVDHHWIWSEKEGTGGRPSEKYVVNPRAREARV